MKLDPHANQPVLHAGASLQQADLAVVLLHGRGASAEDILQLVPAFNLSDVAYVAPQASGHVWYPQSFMAPREMNEPYLTSALAAIHSIVNSIETHGISRERIVVAGFSQGACLSAEYVSRNPARFGGLLAFTGGLIGAPGTLQFPASSKDAAPLSGMPALLCSGDPDPHVPWHRVEESAAILSSMGASATTRRYPGRPHTISQQEIDLARSLLDLARS